LALSRSDRLPASCTPDSKSPARISAPAIWEVTENLTWSRTWDEITGFMRRAALAETAAHVEYLQRRGRLVVHPGSAGEPDRLQIAAAGSANP
jgi:hypothetical protein